MAGPDEDQKLEPFGRIKLDRIYFDWASGHHLNPRLLASELAATIASCSPSDQPIQTLHASVMVDGRPDRTTFITFGSLANYFDDASAGRQAHSIQTSSGTVPAANVLIWKKWIDRLVDEATARTEIAAGFAQPANDSGKLTLTMNGAAAKYIEPQLPFLSGSSPVILKAQQLQLRSAGEKTASEKLEEERDRREKADQEIVKVTAQLEALTAKHQQTMDEFEILRRELNDERRLRRETEDENIRMEEQLEQVMGLAEFMNEDNRLSPPDGRLIVQCWLEVTHDGVTAPTIGWSTLVSKWFKARGVTPTALKVKLFVAALTSSGRKKGGAIATRRNKG
jgi:hypothetical protein